MGELKKLRIGSSENTVTPYTAADDTVVIQNHTVKVNTNKIATKASVDGKVDKEAGKGLSTNDFTNAEKSKLAGIEAQANKTVVDSALSTSSTNPVQNKAVANALAQTNEDITDLQDALDGKVDDVQVNGTSVVNQGVANVPIADSSTLGVVRVEDNQYTGIGQNRGLIYVSRASDYQIKGGANENKPIVPSNQNTAVFYGLAKAASDTTQSASSNSVGQYTDAAKVAIQKMLGIYDPPWELIREDTFTSATESNIDITVDDNGQPFELTDIYCTFSLPTQETDASVASYGRVRFYNKTGSNFLTLYMGAWTQASGSASKNATQLIEQEKGVLKFDYTRNATDGAEPGIVTLNARPQSNVNDSGRYVFPTTPVIISRVVYEAIIGTAKVRVFGKRVWS